MDWSAFVSLVAVAVAGLSVWLNYRERVSSHRQTIYQKQIEAYGAMAREGWLFFVVYARSLATDLKAAERKQRCKAASEQFDSLQMTFMQNMVFFPASVGTKFSKVQKLYAEWLHSGDTELKAESLQKDAQEAAEAFADALDAARNALGIEPLSRDILNAVGAGAIAKKK